MGRCSACMPGCSRRRRGARDLERVDDLPAVERARLPARQRASRPRSRRRATASRCSPTTASNGWRSTPATAKAGLDRGADQFPPGRPGNPLHRRGCRGCRVHRAGRARGRDRGGARRAFPSRQRTSSISARGTCPAGYRGYEDLLAAGQRPRARPATVSADDPWTLMYTSGTTGKPKGAIRSHRGNALLSLITEIELGIHREDERAAGHADVPRELALLLRRVHLLRRRRPRSTRARASTRSTACETLGGERRDLHLARADPLHHDARPAGGRARDGYDSRPRSPS